MKRIHGVAAWTICVMLAGCGLQFAGISAEGGQHRVPDGLMRRLETKIPRLHPIYEKYVPQDHDRPVDTVVYRVQIDSTGRMKMVFIHETTWNNFLFEDRARSCIRKWRFYDFDFRGRPINLKFPVVYRNPYWKPDEPMPNPEDS